MFGRLISLVIALALVALAWFVWTSAGETKTAAMQTPTATDLTALTTTPGIRDCIDTRTAQLNQMVTDGFSTQEQVDIDIQSAINLCIQQAGTPRQTQF